MWLQEPRISAQYQTQPLNSLSPSDAQPGASPKSQSRQWQHIFYCSVHRKQCAFNQSQCCNMSNWTFWRSLDFLDKIVLFTVWIQYIHWGQVLWPHSSRVTGSILTLDYCLNLLSALSQLPKTFEEIAYTKCFHRCVHGALRWVGAPSIWQMPLFNTSYKWTIIIFFTLNHIYLIDHWSCIVLNRTSSDLFPDTHVWLSIHPSSILLIYHGGGGAGANPSWLWACEMIHSGQVTNLFHG